MTNQLIVEEVIHRIGREKAASYGIQSIVRQLNELYHAYNRRFKGAVKKNLTITFAADATDFSYTLPSSFIEPYNIIPEAIWRPPVIFDPTEHGVYTIDQGKIQFVAAAGLTFTVKYFSKGLTMVVLDPGQVAQDGVEITSPEWEDDLHWLLMVALATRLSTEYPLWQSDLADRVEYERQLKKAARVSQTSASPQIEGPLERKSMIEDDDYNPDLGSYFI